MLWRLIILGGCVFSQPKAIFVKDICQGQIVTNISSYSFHGRMSGKGCYVLHLREGLQEQTGEQRCCGDPAEVQERVSRLLL